MLVIVLAFNVIGCTTKENGSTAVGNPVPSTFSPTGTIQGNLVDVVTQQPIVGAIVDIGAGQATTSSTGEFVIYNVPATTDSLNNTVNGTYNVTIDLRNVTSPVLMSSPTATYKYPNFSYSTVSVSYTSLDDTSANNPGGGSGSNHDTPVSGLVAPLPLAVGKLASNIVGVVTYSNTSPINALQSVGAGWTVELVSTGSNNAGTPSGTGTAGTGNTGNVVAVTLTGANGDFTFNNIESMQAFAIRAWDPTNTFYGTKNVTSVADGQTLTLVPQTSTNNTVLNQTVLVNTIDNIAPFISTVSPEVGSDITPTGGVNVIYTFSEPIRQGAYALCLTNSGVAGSCLYKDIAVNFMGAKAGNIAYALSWNAAATQLTVNIPTLASSSTYSVDLTGALGVGKLTDDSFNNTSAADPKRIVTFSTNGGPIADAPINLVITNSASLDFNSQVVFDWLPASGARAYHVYRMPIQMWSGATETLPIRLIGTVSDSAFTDNFTDDVAGNKALSHDIPANNIFAGISFDEKINIQLKYVYTVVSLNTDSLEGPASASVTAVDVMGANLTNGAAIFADITDGDNTLTVYFNEPLDEASAEIAANYTLAAGSIATSPTISSATYNGWNAGTNTSSVTLTLSANVSPANIMRSYISAGADGVLNSTPVAGDTVLNGKCIAPAAGAALKTTVAAGDDVIINTGPAALIGVWAGVNGVCDTAAAVGDTQVVAVAATPAVANQIAILAATVTAGALNFAGTDFTLQSIRAGDDVIVNQALVTVGAGVKDYAGNTLNLNRTAGAVSSLMTNLTLQ